jgi:hypothetical protein
MPYGKAHQKSETLASPAIATVEALCAPSAEYALAYYDGAREIEPIDARW